MRISSRTQRFRQAELTAAARAQLALGLVAIAFGIPPAGIMSRSRRAPVVFARQTAMYLLHVVFRMSPSRVGRAFGRDRTTADHAFHVVEDARDDPKIDALIETCAQSLRGLPELQPPDSSRGARPLIPILLGQG